MSCEEGEGRGWGALSRGWVCGVDGALGLVDEVG